jgi:membrane protease YdiL (CAAX protease family)
MAPQATTSDWRAVHGALFVVLMIGTLLVSALRNWPWLWLAPLTSYFAVVACVPPMRRSFQWLRVGRVTGKSLGVSVALIAVTSSALWLFHHTTHGLASSGPPLPLRNFGAGLASCITFATLNGIFEELVFRGILFDALESQWGKWLALLLTSVAFGVGHLHGYPSNPIGGCLAGLFGAALGGLRLWTSGLALPIVVHIAADATIFRLVMQNP